ncbi:MAG: AAA domain-containing protein, partial [Limnobacter sp.]|nr:AAA domain-containing protein [Limnobacter sp.]
LPRPSGRRPYSVVLLDEVEKAHPDVHEIFFQVFDKGWMEDGEGRKIDFRNTLILLTTNAGTERLMHLCARGEQRTDPAELATQLKPDLLEVFPPALLGRLIVVPYYPLSDHMLTEIAQLQINRVVERVNANHGLEVVLADSVLHEVVKRCQDTDSGGRAVGAILTHTMLPEISRRLLQAQLEGQAISTLTIKAGTDGFEYELQ